MWFLDKALSSGEIDLQAQYYCFLHLWSKISPRMDYASFTTPSMGFKFGHSLQILQVWCENQDPIPHGLIMPCYSGSNADYTDKSYSSLTRDRYLSRIGIIALMPVLSLRFLWPQVMFIPLKLYLKHEGCMKWSLIMLFSSVLSIANSLFLVYVSAWKLSGAKCKGLSVCNLCWELAGAPNAGFIDFKKIADPISTCELTRIHGSIEWVQSKFITPKKGSNSSKTLANAKHITFAL